MCHRANHRIFSGVTPVERENLSWLHSTRLSWSYSANNFSCFVFGKLPTVSFCTSSTNDGEYVEQVLHLMFVNCSGTSFCSLWIYFKYWNHDVFCKRASLVRVCEPWGAPAGCQSRDCSALRAGRALVGRQGPLREGQRRLPRTCGARGSGVRQARPGSHRATLVFPAPNRH